MDLFRHTVIDDDFSTFDPENDEVFSIKDVKSLLYEQKANREEFESNLHDQSEALNSLQIAWRFNNEMQIRSVEKMKKLYIKQKSR